MICCSRPRRRRCSPSRPIRSTSEPASASRRYCTAGARPHHPHLHMVVPGGGLSIDDSRWISCKPNFLLPVRVLSKLFRRLMLEKLLAAHKAGSLQFLGSHAHLADAKTFAAFLAPLSKKRWFVYAKRPFAGPKAVLAYLSRYTHRVAISNRRLIAVDQTAVRDGDAVRIARQIGEHGLWTRERVLGVDEPALLAERGEERRERLGIGQMRM